ncbi:single-stranded DNA-binding protein [Clostridium sp. MD294]|uniref:single-stranded DNA-binding protein n=1 Tax=Clostridium sp. MD294 TaxID=97138 RepID=UPI0002CCC989|nr:single-stranded DNA-binding protein [Clostridium sp. MD294]NDO45990.1 single-stranded DNA-binding protein [Clostridium sp. MD294]USF30349.1 Single-stranded DNA-binding protein A [Clostridium sp. MD294]
MNKVILMGRLTKKPEVKYTQQNVAVARYTLAVARRFQQKGQSEVDFINCITFGKSAEFAQKYLNKGKQIAIVGKIQVRSWENENSQKQWSTEVIVEEQYFADSKVNETEGNSFNTVEQSDDDLPF